MILFETERMIVRRFAESDAESFFRVNGDPDVMRYIRPAKTREQSDAFLHENLIFYKEGSVLGRYAVFSKSNASFLGSFSFLYLEGEADFHIGYALVPEAWGKGYATELVQFGMEYYFSNTDKRHLFAITEPGNLASQKVLLKNGFNKKEQMEEPGTKLDVFYISRGSSFSN